MKSLLNTVSRMKIIIIAMLVMVSLGVLGAYSAGTSRPKRDVTIKKGNHVRGEILVKYKKTINYASRRASVEGKGGKFLKEFGRARLVHVRLPEGAHVEEAVKEYAADPDVEYAQPNYIYRGFAAPNDTRYGQQWGLNNTGQTVDDASYGTNNPGTASKDMGLQSSWDVINDCGAVTVAVVDSGVNYTHEDLSGNMWDGGVTFPHHGYDFVNDDNDPMDLYGHGTHVAGIIGARGNNATGTTGVCWSVKIMAVRVLDAMNVGSTADIVSGIQFAITNGADVINLSLGGTDDDPSFSDAITDARDQDIVVIAAAGNDGLNLNTSGNNVYPCEFTNDNMLCVAALDQDYERASFSNYSSTSVDVGAPGTNIWSEYHGTETMISDDFSGDWTKGGEWNEVDCDFSAGVTDMLVNPSDWCSLGEYNTSAIDRAYKNFDLSSYAGAVLVFQAFVDVEYGYDYFNINYRSTGGNPFISGVALDSMTGSTGGYSQTFWYDISPCNTASCGIGFELDSDITNTDYGIGIFNFNIIGIAAGTAEYQVSDGTSMAAPFVTGVASLLKAYNPSYTYADIVQSIKAGGDSETALTATTSTGRAADAWGSLCYIVPPTGVSAVVEQ